MSTMRIKWGYNEVTPEGELNKTFLITDIDGFTVATTHDERVAVEIVSFHNEYIRQMNK